jgi:hypothetical protein
VGNEGGECQKTGQDRVPVEDAGLGVRGAEVRPQRLEEVAIVADGNAAHHVAQGDAVEEGQ